MNNRGTLVIAPIRPQSDEDTFPSALANEIAGGFKTVATLVERDAIPAERRTVGMACFVEAEGNLYLLRDGIENADWALFDQDYVGLPNVDNTADADKPVSTAQQAALDLKAPIDSPTFTGIPTAPDPDINDDTTQIATTSFVQGKVSGGATPDASSVTKGKVRLAGDLGGTADSPRVNRMYRVFNPLDYGALGDGVHDDTEALLEAMADAGAVGGDVRCPPGVYLISQPLQYNKLDLTTSVTAPSLIGSEGRAGPSIDFANPHSIWGQVSSHTIKCSDDFPLGEYMIDFLGPYAQDCSISGYTIGGFVLDCNGRGAGMRNLNPFSAHFRDIVIDNEPQIPNPALPGAFLASSSNTGAFNICGKPTQNSFHNTVNRIYVRSAPIDGFQFASGAGSFDLIAQCCANNSGRFGYNIEDKATLVSCIAQANAKTKGLDGADWKIGRYNVTLIAPISFSGKPTYGNGIKVAGGPNSIAKVIGGTFYGAINPEQDLDEGIAAVVNITGALQNIEFTGTHFLTGNNVYTSDFVYVGPHATGRATFTACQFMDEQGSPLANVPINTNGNDSVVSFLNCHGINPVVPKRWGNITNAVQSLESGLVGGVPTGGTFTLTFDGQTTAPLNFNATAAQIQSALRALSNIGPTDVVCTGGDPVSEFPVFVNFQDALGNSVQPTITANNAGLTGGTAPQVTVKTIVPGGPNVTFKRKEGHFQSVVLSGDIAPTIVDGDVIGDEITFQFIQDAIGSRVVDPWPPNVKLAGGSLILSTPAGSVDTVALWWDGTDWREGSRALARVFSMAEGGTGVTDAADLRAAISALNSNGDVMTGMLEFDGPTNPGLKVNSLDTTERDALTPANGMFIYNTSNNRFEKYENGAWAPTSGAGGGDVVGPASATDNAIARHDGTSGKIIQDSVPIVQDDGRISTVTNPTAAQDVATKTYTDNKFNGAPVPSDSGYLARNFEFLNCSNANSNLGSNGTVYVQKLRTDVAITVTNLHAFVSSIGSSLTSGQCFAALYDSNKNLLATTADQSAAWVTTGLKTMALTSPQSVPAGNFYVVLWANGTTRPAFAKAWAAGTTSAAAVNGLLSAADSRWALANTSITTTAPSSLGAFTQTANAYWVGVS